jgi:hypothetical protein
MDRRWCVADPCAPKSYRPRHSSSEYLRSVGPLYRQNAKSRRSYTSGHGFHSSLWSSGARSLEGSDPLGKNLVFVSLPTSTGSHP